MRRAIFGIIGMVVLLILFLPFPTKIAETIEVRFVSESGQSIQGSKVAERWECYGLWGSGREVAATDSSGYVHFPARVGYGTVTTRAFAHLFKLISVHSSYGGYVSLDCFIDGSSYKALFPSPAFTPLTGQYMDTMGRYYFPQESSGGQVISVSGDFMRPAEAVKIILVPADTNKPDAGKLGSPAL